jgi:hypothetical protein
MLRSGTCPNLYHGIIFAAFMRRKRASGALWSRRCARCYAQSTSVLLRWGGWARLVPTALERTPAPGSLTAPPCSAVTHCNGLTALGIAVVLSPDGAQDCIVAHLALSQSSLLPREHFAGRG